LNAIKALDLSIPLHELLSQILIEHVNEVTRKQWEIKALSQGVTDELMDIGTWDVNTMLIAGKMQEIVDQIVGSQKEIVALQQIR
jgi:hypothetical protein